MRLNAELHKETQVLRKRCNGQILGLLSKELRVETVEFVSPSTSSKLEFSLADLYNIQHNKYLGLKYIFNTYTQLLGALGTRGAQQKHHMEWQR